MGVERTLNKSAQRVNSGDENSLTTPAGIQTHNFLIMGQVLYQQANPAPFSW